MQRLSRGAQFSFVLTAFVWAWLVALGAARAPQASQIPAGPEVRVSDGWFHLDDCSIAVARQAPRMPLADALRKRFGPCPICEPYKTQPEWATFVATHEPAIKEEVRLKAEAEAAEAKRKLEEAEAERKRRLAEIEDERKRKESAPVVRLTEAQTREIAQAALAEARDDATAFQTKFRQLVRAISPEYAGPQVAYGSPALKVLVAGPVSKFEAAVMDRLQRKMPPLAAPWSADVTVSVLPDRDDAPDITQVVVQRTDATRQVGAESMATVLSSTLASKRLPGAGPSGKFIHYGDVVFPITAFEPGLGVVVRVIAVPAAGATLSRSFPSLALRAIQ